MTIQKKIRILLKCAYKLYPKGKKMNALKSSIAKKVKQKTLYDLKDYAKIKGLSVRSLYNGYLSKKAKKILIQDKIL